MEDITFVCIIDDYFFALQKIVVTENRRRKIIKNEVWFSFCKGMYSTQRLEVSQNNQWISKINVRGFDKIISFSVDNGAHVAYSITFCWKLVK